MANAKILKFWTMPIVGYDTGSVMGEEIANFEKSHPDIKIDLSIIPWTQAWKKILSAAKSKELPDVFEIGNTWTKTLSAINALSDLSERARTENIKSGFYPAAWATCEIQGLDKVYALPWNADTRMIFYRKDIFGRIGISSADLESWESFENVCKELSKFDSESGRIGALGVSDVKDAGLVHDIASWIWASGGNFLSDETNSAIFDKEEAVRAIKFYFDLIHKGYAPIGGRKVPVYPAPDFFTGGKYGMCITGAAVAADFIPGLFSSAGKKGSSDMTDKFSVALLPAGPGGRFSFLGGTNMAVSGSTPYQDEAWEFINFLTSKDFQLRQYKSIGAFPTRIEAFLTLFNEGSESQRILLDTYSKYGRSYKQVDFWASIEFILAELFGKIVDSLKAQTYSEVFLVSEINKAAEQVNYILSL